MATIDDLAEKLDEMDLKLDEMDAKLDDLEQKIEAARTLTIECPRCLGSGITYEYQQPLPEGGPSVVEVTCPMCDGATRVVFCVEEAL